MSPLVVAIGFVLYLGGWFVTIRNDLAGHKFRSPFVWIPAVVGLVGFVILYHQLWRAV